MIEFLYVAVLRSMQIYDDYDDGHVDFLCVMNDCMPLQFSMFDC